MFDNTLKRAVPALVVAGSIVIGITGIAAANPLTDRQVDPTTPTLPADPDSTKVDPAPDPAPAEKAPPDSDEEPAPDKAPTPEPATADPELPGQGTAPEPQVLSEERPPATIEHGSHHPYTVHVSTDSVVATVDVWTSFEAPSQITVYWGDEQTDTRNAATRPTFGGGSQLSKYTQFKHAYEAPADGTPFPSRVQVRIVHADGSVSYEAENIELTPRYRVTVYDASFRPLSHCDGGRESNSEFLITQTAGERDDLSGYDTTQERWWRWQGPTRDEALETGPYYRLPGSIYSAEVTKVDPAWPSGVYQAWVGFEVLETEDFEDDKLVGRAGILMHPELGSGRLVETPSNRSGCHVEIRVDYETRLLRPGIGTNGGDPNPNGLIAIN